MRWDFHKNTNKRWMNMFIVKRMRIFSLQLVGAKPKSDFSLPLVLVKDPYTVTNFIWL